MTEAFVPLMPGALPGSNPGGAFRLKPISNSFEPTTAPKPAPEAALHPAHGEPKITLERQGEVITHIRVQCGCGQVMELKCEY